MQGSGRRIPPATTVHTIPANQNVQIYHVEWKDSFGYHLPVAGNDLID
jgi:hypothetical protein